ncbi:RagB/SusD family nutrient uptake outer membrane protein [Pedobacter sp. SYSU D00535]|uniref:RagB/SusD family nutrient uptake outer membrane protein n=1 Tax=Pedobacter sp. SYSU D00535 TaxID=2810308 RepID=UPI001A97210B|nr:RagB/SusD family nutrient uptake outer membrane protein [Pedobacter sp. SYSU D00535]
MNLKETIKISCTLIGLSLTAFSCNEKELLNPEPPTQIQEANVFTSPERIQGVVNGMYAKVKAANFYGGRYLMVCDIRGEEFINRTQNVFTGYDAWSHTVISGSNDASNSWIAIYAAINSANILIKGLEDNAGKVEATLAAQYTGEAKFVRALSYYSLITLYAQPYVKDAGASPGVPLRLSAEVSPENNNMPLSTVAAVYTQILKDLDEAEASLPAAYTGSSAALLNTTRAHKSTAIALKTRVYLTMGNYPKVIEEATKIVSASAPFKTTFGVQHQLQADVKAVFAPAATTVESILSMPMTDLDFVSGQSALAYEYWVNKEYNLNPSGIVGDTEWRTADARRGMIATASNLPYLLKYSDIVTPYTDFIPVIRYAEVLLNYAEALARISSPDLAKATDLLYAVRRRSDPTYTYPATALASPAAFVSTVLKERRIELLGEGFRSNDLLRNLMTIPAKGSGGLSSPSVGPNESSYVFPIPNAEISTNKAL